VFEAKGPGLLVRGSRRGVGAEGTNGSIANVIAEAKGAGRAVESGRWERDCSGANRELRRHSDRCK